MICPFYFPGARSYCTAQWACGELLQSSLNLKQGLKLWVRLLMGLCLWVFPCFILLLLVYLVSQHLSFVKPSWLCELKDQDYRTCPKYVKPSKLIRLGGVPETATKDDVSGTFLIQKLLLRVSKVPLLSLVNVYQMVCHFPRAKSRFRSHCNVTCYLIILGFWGF